MENSTVNITTPQTQAIGPLEILETCAHLISFLFGAPANVWVIWLIVTGTRSGVTSEFFFLNLSVCEIMICLNNLVTILPIYFSNLSNSPLFLQGLNMTGRPLFQSLICVERYLAVVHPVTFLKSKPLRYRLICCSASWIIILGSCFFSLFIVSENTHVRIWSISTQYVLFFSIQLLCLLAVLRALKQSGPGDRRREKEENHMKRRAFKVILITIVTMNFSYIPSIMTGFSIIVAQNNAHIFWLPSLVCFILGSFIHPVIYLHRAGKLSCSVTCKCDILPVNLLSLCCFR